MKEIKAGDFYKIPDADGFVKEFKIKEISIDRQKIKVIDREKNLLIFEISRMKYGIEQWEKLNKNILQKFLFNFRGKK